MGWAADVRSSAHVYVPGLTDVVDLDGDDAHHLTRVLRLRAGEVVTAADGAGRWRPYVLAAGARLEAQGEPDDEPVLHPRLGVAFALTKGDKPDLVVQKLTELGVDRILPVVAERSVARPDPERAGTQVERWRRVAREAGKQCRRARLPAIDEVAPLAALAGHPGLVVADRAGGPPPRAGKWGEEVIVVVGPEGGLTPGETEALRPVARLGLGPHVLRAETAAVAAAAVLAPGRGERR